MTKIFRYVAAILVATVTSAASATDTTAPKASVASEKAGVQPQAEMGKWDGFRGIRWGTSIKNLAGFEAPNSVMAELGNYLRKDEKLSIGPIRLKEILWRFYKGNLYHVVITGEMGTFPDLKAHVINRFGKTYKDISNKYREACIWSGKDSSGSKVTLEVSRDKESGRVSCYFTFVPLQEQESADMRTKEAEEKKSAEAEALKTAIEDVRPDW